MKTFIAILILTAALTAQAQESTWHSDSVSLHRQSLATDSLVEASLFAVDLFDSSSVAAHNARVDSARTAFARQWEDALAREAERRRKVQDSAQKP